MKLPRHGSVEASMEAFMSFHQNADSAGGPSSSRAAMKRSLKKIACLGGGGIVESVFSYFFPLRLASNCAYSRYVLPARSLSQQWLVFTVVFFFIFQEFFVYSRLYLVHTAYWISCAPLFQLAAFPGISSKPPPGGCCNGNLVATTTHNIYFEVCRSIAEDRTNGETKEAFDQRRSPRFKDNQFDP